MHSTKAMPGQSSHLSEGFWDRYAASLRAQEVQPTAVRWSVIRAEHSLQAVAHAREAATVTMRAKTPQTDSVSLARRIGIPKAALAPRERALWSPPSPPARRTPLALRVHARASQGSCGPCISKPGVMHGERLAYPHIVV